MQSITRIVLVLNHDVMRGAQIASIGRALGYQVMFERDPVRFFSRLAEETVALGIVDLNVLVNWPSISLAPDSAPFIAFGPHMNAEALRAAKAAGAARVMANSEFHQNAATHIERYARR